MQVVTQDRYGSVDVLTLAEVARPVPAAGQVLVRVRAAGVNALDWHVMRGSPIIVRPMIGWRRPKPAERGVDVAGTVEAVGSGVTRFRPGDDVFGWCFGAFAEYAVATEDELVSKPSELTFEQAAAVPTSAMTALRGLRDVGRVTPGQRVLIVGASGGVGTYAVQIAASMGAQVTGTCSTRNLDLVRALGAEAIDYTRHDPTAGGTRYDVIFELAGTRSPWSYRRALTPDGTLVLSSGAGGRWVGPIVRMVSAAVLARFVRQRLVVLSTNPNLPDLQALTELIVAGTVRPVMDRTFALRDAPDAIRYVEAGHTRGKSVITMA